MTDAEMYNCPDCGRTLVTTTDALSVACGPCGVVAPLHEVRDDPRWRGTEQ